MTKYQQTANPNATNSELDATQFVIPTIPDCDLPVTLTEDQISTILYVLEGYVQGKNDIGNVNNFEELVSEIDTIFEKLESVVDSHYDRLDELCKEI
jgi:hypothetical protein